jgi:hypothetical protein
MWLNPQGPQATSTTLATDMSLRVTYFSTDPTEMPPCFNYSGFDHNRDSSNHQAVDTCTVLDS